MQVRTAEQVPAEIVQRDDVAGVQIRWLIGQRDNPDNFYMRMFELAPGGHTPYHGHPWEHEIFVLEGEGEAVSPQGNQALRPQTVIYVSADEAHQFRNTGDRPLKFLCLVPKSARY